MRAIFALAVVAVLALAAVPAYANVTYDFILGSIESTGTNQILQLSPGTTVAEFTVTDAIVETGSMGFNVYTPSPFPSYFLSTGFDFGGSIVPDTNVYVADFGVTFNPDGTLTGSIFYETAFAGYIPPGITGSGSSWSGRAGDDLNQVVQFTGHWQAQGPLPVPEPSSLALMLSAIGVMVGVCRRRRLPA